jgi:hypothetical protein
VLQFRLGEPEYRSSAFQAGGFMRTAKFAGVLALAIVSASLLSAEVMRRIYLALLGEVRCSKESW